MNSILNTFPCLMINKDIARRQSLILTPNNNVNEIV